MRRRDFIKVAGSAIAWPFAAHAQQPATPIVGLLRSTPLAPFQNLVVALGQGLKEAGFVEGQNVAIEYRYADNQIDRLPVLVADLIRLPVAVIVVNMGAAFAAKAATTTGATLKEFRSVSPDAINRVRKRNTTGIARIPCVFGHSGFLRGALDRERRKRRAAHLGSY